MAVKLRAHLPINHDKPVLAQVIQAMLWATKALDDIKVKAEIDGRVITLVRGLWSGWRSTTFINTVFNHVYGEILDVSERRATGIKPTVMRDVLGDDM